MDTPNNLIEREKELQDAPLLRSAGAADFFKAPDGYFDTLSSTIQDRIQETKKTFIIPVFRPAFAGFSFALLIICVAIYFVGSLQHKNQFQAQQETPSIDAIIESGYYIDMDESLISEALCEMPIKNDTTQQYQQDQELENYLIQSLNETTLINEL